MKKDLIIMLLIFLGMLLFGSIIFGQFLAFTTERGVLYLSAVIAASAFWAGRKK